MKAGGLFTRKSIVFRFFVPFTLILAILFTVLLLSNIYSLEVVRTLKHMADWLQLLVGGTPVSFVDAKEPFQYL